MSKAKYHLEIESQRRGQDSYETYYLMGVNTMPDGEVIRLDLHRSSDPAEIRQIAKQRANSEGCFVKEAL